MGWWFHNSDYRKPNGDIDRKAEMDSVVIDEGFQLIKSALVGVIYYAAIKDNNSNNVFGFIAITTSDKKNGYNFGYKGIDETMGPFFYNCPISILKLLTPTDNEEAKYWRDMCLKNTRP